MTTGGFAGGHLFLAHLSQRLKVSFCDHSPSVVIVYQDCSSNRDLSKNMAARGWSLFSLYMYIENLKKIFLSGTTGPISL